MIHLFSPWFLATSSQQINISTQIRLISPQNHSIPKLTISSFSHPPHLLTPSSRSLSSPSLLICTVLNTNKILFRIFTSSNHLPPPHNKFLEELYSSVFCETIPFLYEFRQRTAIFLHSLFETTLHSRGNALYSSLSFSWISYVFLLLFINSQDSS